MKKFIWIGLILASLQSIAQSDQPQDNPELLQIFKEDQGDRRSQPIDWKVVSKRDSLRRARVDEIIAEQNVRTGKDYYHVAMIYQHGHDSVDYGAAVKMMEKAIELDSNTNKWLYAAAVDRYLMSRKKPQIYGTQYVRQEGKWALYQIDTTVISPEVRAQHHVRTLAEQREQAKSMNRKKIESLEQEGKNVDEIIAVIKAQNRKDPEYDITESAINMWGYDLMSANRDKAALKVFKLNTELYPKGWNTYDSYGELLMKMGKYKESKKMYLKSLELNPDNKNGQSMIEEMEKKK